MLVLFISSSTVSYESNRDYLDFRKQFIVLFIAYARVKALIAIWLNFSRRSYWEAILINEVVQNQLLRASLPKVHLAGCPARQSLI